MKRHRLFHVEVDGSSVGYPGFPREVVLYWLKNCIIVFKTKKQIDWVIEALIEARDQVWPSK